MPSTTNVQRAFSHQLPQYEKVLHIRAFHCVLPAYLERHKSQNRLGHEQLPFKKFNPNTAWYYSMLLGHFLMESFKKDVSAPVLPVGAYATTVRRKLIDIADKVVKHGKTVILKVPQACFKHLRLLELFNRCKYAPAIL
jgi:hypothetical protein